MRDQKSSRASPIYKSQVINRSHQWMSPCKIIGGQSHKPSMTVNYDSTVVKYDCRVRYKICQERCKKSMKSRTSHFNYKAFSGFFLKILLAVIVLQIEWNVPLDLWSWKHSVCQLRHNKVSPRIAFAVTTFSRLHLGLDSAIYHDCLGDFLKIKILDFLTLTQKNFQNWEIGEKLEKLELLLLVSKTKLTETP